VVLIELGLYYKDGALIPMDEIQLDEMSNNLEQDGLYIIKVEKVGEKKMRTFQQNAALHKYLDLLAHQLNEGGFDIRKVLESMRKGFAISCTRSNLKETVWRPMQQALFNVESSTQLDTKQISEVYKHVDRFTAERFGITQSWPNRHGD
jgi:hypothetical protein